MLHYLAMSLFNKNMLLGVTGGVAAYKSAQLVRDVQRSGAHVRVMMSRQAVRFVTPLTFQALSGTAVILDGQESDSSTGAMPHIDLARWADILLIAPASANTMARLANGIADDILSTTCLAYQGRIVIAPAMNRSMWEHPAVQQNRLTLLNRGVQILGPDTGLQACGDDGLGRMLEPLEIIAQLEQQPDHAALSRTHVLITAGPTREPLDPVRYLTNRSSGKMGYALAHAALEQGAQVTLISGPVSLACDPRITLLKVETAMEMHQAVLQRIHSADMLIACAAVADYRPQYVAGQKIKKASATKSVTLVPNPDILKEVRRAAPEVFTIGFAAETERLENNALHKLRDKSLDMIVANDVSHASCGFDSDYNQADIYWQDQKQSTKRILKTELAREIIALASKIYLQKASSNVHYIEDKAN